MDMDMGSATTTAMESMASMASMAMTATASTASASSTAMAMSMSGSSSSSCKISMLWNWYTIDSCFISKTWHNTSRSMFAGSCVGVFFLVVSLEFLKRSAREYDRYLVKTWQARKTAMLNSLASADNSSGGGSGSITKSGGVISKGTDWLRVRGSSQSAINSSVFRPTLYQQGIRSIFHVFIFGVGYFIMLMAMYYNGYIIICILLGALAGHMVFGADTLSCSTEVEEQPDCCCGD